MRVFTLLFSFLFIVSIAPASAVKAKAPMPKTPVNSVDGILFPKGQVGVILKNIYLNKDGLFDGDHESDTVKEKKINKTVLAIRYGLIDNLELKLKVPYADFDLTKSPTASTHNAGLGDTRLHARYQFLSQKRGDKVFLFGGLGLKMPTGQTDHKTGGTIDPATMQPGSGSWDPIIDAAVTKKMGPLKLNGYLSYTLTSEGDNDYEWGDQFLSDISAVYAINKYVDVEMELNSVWRDKDQKNGADIDKTGGHQVYLTPGVHVKFLKKSHFALGFPITIYRDLNGPQLSEDYRVVSKLAFVF